MKSTYKKFNLEEALNGAKLETREGLKVKAVHLIENTNNPSPLVVVVEDPSGGHDDIISCTANGRFWGEGGDSSLDLFIVKEPKTHYVNVYKDFKTGQVTTGGKLYNTEREAMDNVVYGSSLMKYLKTISFTDELENPCEKIDVDTDTMDLRDLKDISSIINSFMGGFK